MTGKGSEVAEVMRRRKINIMCVQETRWKGHSTREIGEGFKLFYAGSEKKNGVGIIFDKELKKQVIKVQRISDRLLMAKVIVDTEVVSIVSAYALQQVCKASEKEEFLEQLEDLVRPVNRSEKCFIGADLNGNVGEKKDGFERVHGGFGFGRRNEEGEEILHFAQGLDLSIVNTNFKKKEEHNIRYKSYPYESQIDYILTRREDAKEVKDCKVIPGEPAVKQHRFMIADIRRKPGKKRKRVAAMKRIRTWKLKDRRRLFNEEMAKEMEKMKDLSWEKLRDVTTKVLKNTCGVTNGKSQEPKETWWWNEKLQETVKRKKEAFKVWQQDRGDTEKKQLYKDSNKAVKKSVAEAKMEAEKDLYDELELKEGQAKIYRIAKIRQRKRQDITEISCIKDSARKLLVEMRRFKIDRKSIMKIF